MTVLPKLFSACQWRSLWPQASLWKGFLIHHYHCEETTVLELCLSCIKTHCPVWALHTNTIHQQVWEEIFFFPAEGCYVWSVWGKCERTKVAGKGHSACRRISSLCRGKKRGKPWYSWLCRSIYTAELAALLCSLIDIEIWQWSAKLEVICK